MFKQPNDDKYLKKTMKPTYTSFLCYNHKSIFTTVKVMFVRQQPLATHTAVS